MPNDLDFFVASVQFYRKPACQKVEQIRIVLIIFWIIGGGVTLLSQKLQFDHLTSEAGLSQNQVRAILQDSQGFLWIGTQDGLNRYDGRQFKVYRHLRNDTNSLTHSYINTLVEDRQGNIWIGTRLGLNRYNPRTETFTPFFFEGEKKEFEGANFVHHILEDHRGFIWCGTYNGLFRLEPKTGAFLRFIPQIDNPGSINHELTWQIFEDRDSNLWFGTQNGLALYPNDESFRFTQFLPEPQTPGGLKTDRIWGFSQLSDGSLWMGSDNGLHQAIFQSGEWQFRNIQHDPNNPNSLSHNFIESMFTSKEEDIWVSTYNGGINRVQIVNKDSIYIERFQHNPNDPNSINSNYVLNVIEDHSGIIWACTSNGLDKADPHTRKFRTIRKIPNTPNSLANNFITSVLKDSRGDLWLGTWGGGLHRIRKHDLDAPPYALEVFHYDPNDPFSLSNDQVNGLYEDNNGYLWITTYKGLNYIRLDDFDESQQFRAYTNLDGLPHRFTYSVLQDHDNVYWVATYGQLSKMTFDPERHEGTHFQNYDMDPDRDDALVNATTYSLCRDRFGHTWIGTFNGISKYQEDNGREYFENYNRVLGDSTSLSDNLIHFLFLDSKGRMWAGTKNGLNLFLQTGPHDVVKFKTFGIPEGFPNEDIHSALEDEEGNFWLGTNAGLVVFNPDLALAKPGEGVIQTYDARDGLAGNEFSSRAAVKDDKGCLYFGGPDGCSFFHPSQLPKNEYIPPVVLTEFYLADQPVHPGEHKNNPLSQSITRTEEIALKYHQDIFTIEFAALNYSIPEKNQYAYRLLGFNDRWTYPGNRNTATFTNLSPGRYTFEVKGSNNDGVWNPEPRRLTIRVLPPPWRSPWAYALYVLLGGLLAYLFFRYRVAKSVAAVQAQADIERARYEEREELRKKNAADFHDELGHRLTKISLFLELAEREPDKSSPLKNYLAKIKYNAAELSGGIRDLIWTLDPQKDSLPQTLLRLQEFGDKLFEYTDTHFKTEGLALIPESWKLEPDVRKHLLLIFKEAMNNTLKYAEASHAQLLIRQPESPEIIFQDNGIGFSPEHIKNGYGLKNMQERARKIGATLQIESSPKQGTMIKLRLPHLG